MKIRLAIIVLVLFVSGCSENNKLVIEAGANILVSGTTILKSNAKHIKKNINLLKLK